jgi:hypothetical protein
MTQPTKETASVKRTWWAFRIGFWALLGLGAVLILVGLFWPGAIAMMSAAAENLLWRSWTRRTQAEIDNFHASQ